MATFPPFVAHILQELDALVDRHGLEAPFLDAGCGRGDVAAHLARRGWRGEALDPSPLAVARAREALHHHRGVTVVAGELQSYRGGPFATVLMFDLLEHLPDDEAALRAARRLQRPGGVLVLTVPTHAAREWRWDDDLYGHLRRYDPAGIAALVAAAGYEVLEVWDLTYPVFWLLRRGYTRLKPPPPVRGTARERTALSGCAQAWDLGPLSSVLSLSASVLWQPVFAVQRRYRHRIESGHELMLLARRRGS
jgi:SAM-dependent methyltransferase